MKHFYSSLVACVLLAANLPIQAATTDNTFSVTAKTVGKCTISANELAFNTAIPTPIEKNWDASNTLTVICSTTTPYSIGLNDGQGNGATCGDRRMTKIGGAPTDTLKYQLHTDAARSIIFGKAGSTCPIEVEGTGSGAEQFITVYGRIPTQSTTVQGSFSDTITATVTF